MTPPFIAAENALVLEQERGRRYPDVLFGSNVFVGAEVTIGGGTVIGHGVTVHEGTAIGNDVRLDDGCVLGKVPMCSAASATTRNEQLLPAIIGHGCLVGTHAVVYRGATIADGVLLADFATVRENTSIGMLSIIGRGVAVENYVQIGSRCKIETGAYITAMSTIGDLCFVAPEVTFTNDNYLGRSEERFKHFRGVTMERGARIGANATVLPGLSIGADAVVAAGAVVTKNVPPGMLVMGSPARVVRPVAAEQLLTA